MSSGKGHHAREASRRRVVSPQSREPGFAFWIHVTPRAHREGVAGLRGDALRVAVREPPEAGRANAACVAALAEAFGVSRAQVELDPRATGRRKRVRVTGDTAALERRFTELAKPG